MATPIYSFKDLLNHSLHSTCPCNSGNILVKKSAILSLRTPPVLCAAVTRYNLYKLYSNFRTAKTIDEYEHLYQKLT